MFVEGVQSFTACSWGACMLVKGLHTVYMGLLRPQNAMLLNGLNAFKGYFDPLKALKRNI